jgi:hypothetical protein
MDLRETDCEDVNFMKLALGRGNASMMFLRNILVVIVSNTV